MYTVELDSLQVTHNARSHVQVFDDEDDVPAHYPTEVEQVTSSVGMSSTESAAVDVEEHVLSNNAANL
jgi:hypothetical protein